MKKQKKKRSPNNHYKKDKNNKRLRGTVKCNYEIKKNNVKKKYGKE